jgi:hypothetical protein
MHGIRSELESFAQVAGVQDEKATRDAVAMGVALVVFWPALFAIGGNDQQTAELSRLRGELEAIEQTSIRKKCGIRFQRPAPEAADRKSGARVTKLGS